MLKFKVIYIFIFLFFSFLTFSQDLQKKEIESSVINQDSLLSDTNRLSFDSLSSKSQTSDSNSVLRSRSNLKALEKTGKEVDTSGVIYGWKLDRNFIQPEKAEIDTDLVGFQVDNSLIRKYNSVSFLGNVGSAYMPNYFFDRDYNEDLLFLNSYKYYFSTYENTCYINTRKPFTHLLYYNAGAKRDKYEYIELSHSQNASEKFNFGFDLKILSDRGQYKFLDIKNKNFKFFTSYSGDLYRMHANVNLNRYQASENGGIIDSLYLINDPDFTKGYEVNFGGVETRTPYEAYVNNKIRYIDGMVSQQIKLFTIGKSSADSTNSSSIAEPILSHVFIARRSSKTYEELAANDPNIPLYRNTFVNPVETYDSIAESRIINKLQLDFKTRIRKKITVGIYANINHEYLKYSYYSLLDSTLINSPELIYSDTVKPILYYINSNNDTLRYNVFLNRNNNIVYSIDNRQSMSNVYLSGGLYGKFWTYFQSQFSATLFLAGYKAGQTQIDGEMLTQLSILSRPYKFLIKGSIENLVPSYLLNNYYSNNYMWEQNLKNYTRINLSSKIAAPSNKFELSFNYSLLRNYIYLTDSFPMAYNQTFNLMSLGLEKGFKLWKFHSYNKLIYQVTENREIIDVPSVIVYNSTYIDHTWKFKETKGELRTMIGFDVHYNSYFSGYNYIPSLAMFYQENNTEIGNYPFIDFWFNVKLKRTRFFLKYEHANSSWYTKNYYHAVSYPAGQKVLKFGLSWTFYD